MIERIKWAASMWLLNGPWRVFCGLIGMLLPGAQSDRLFWFGVRRLSPNGHCVFVDRLESYVQVQRDKMKNDERLHDEAEVA